MTKIYPLIKSPNNRWIFNLHVYLTMIFISLFLVRCGPSEEDKGSDISPEPDPILNSGPIPSPTFLNCPKGTLISYENFGSGFMSQYCLSCHSERKTNLARAGAPAEVNFDRLKDIQIFRANVLARTRIGQAKPMPPNREIPKEQVLILVEWLDCGAPEKNK